MIVVAAAPAQEEGGPWELDPLLLDERYVAVRVRGRGAIVFSACSHAGIVNAMLAAREAAGGEAPYGVVGGEGGRLTGVRRVF